MVGKEVQGDVAGKTALTTSAIVCDCGGKLDRPIPAKCPHCGATIAAIRHRRWPQVQGLLVAIALFGVLVAFAAWLATR